MKRLSYHNLVPVTTLCWRRKTNMSESALNTLPCPWFFNFIGCEFQNKENYSTRFELILQGEKFERVQIENHYNLWAASYFLQLTFCILQIQFMSCKLKSYELLLRVFPSLSDSIISLEYLERLSATYPSHKKLKKYSHLNE